MFYHYTHLDPLDPSSPYVPDPYKTEEDANQDLRAGCICNFIYLFVVIVLFIIVSLFTGCAPTKEVSSSVSDHRVTDMMQRMDSVLRVKTVVQQDSSWRELVMRQFQSIREKSDTSHYVVADTAGNIIRETLIINNTREVTSETDREQLTVMSHRLEVMDSTLNIMRLQIQHSDSLLQQRQETAVREVAKPLNWWQQARLHLANIILITLALLAVLWILKKRLPWIPFGK